ncbi:Uncharacterised protein [Staphylococcus aureus]|nr:Uncharacterised protein [Staphylococcus aureus]CAC6674780.1 Uncharacterised protein [Staphylococcus aureus]CAC8580387.1 Uncharacterised protein [Staphylococcus aureus]SAO73324.1 Uncharacterised protein [Staphylococcus aureus]SBB47805.1 Uncharacterised protein [Staphylococcus aureus]
MPIGPVKAVKTVPNIGTLVDKKLINPSAFAIPANSGANTVTALPIVLINAPNPKTTGPIAAAIPPKITIDLLEPSLKLENQSTAIDSFLINSSITGANALSIEVHTSAPTNFNLFIATLNLSEPLSESLNV